VRVTVPLRGGTRLADGFDHFLDDMARRGQIGIAHAQINDIRAIVARRRLDPIDLFKHIRGKTFDAVKISHDPELSGRRLGSIDAGGKTTPTYKGNKDVRY
jgi:hypothetical protein